MPIRSRKSPTPKARKLGGRLRGLQLLLRMNHTMTTEERMLVLTRKPDQNIFIGEDIIITICKIHGDRISIGIQAPNEVPIIRKELLPKDEFPEKTRR